MADGAAERDRRPAGHHRSRDGRALRRLHRQRRHRRQLADLPRRHRLHRVALHRHGRARGALRRRERAGEGQSHRLPGVPDGARPLARRAGAARLRPVADAARSRQRDAGGQGRGAAVSAHDVRLQHRDAAVLHARRRAALGRRRPDAAAPRHPHDGPERCVQRHSDSRLRSDSRARHARRRDRHRVGQPDRVVDRHLAAAQRPAGRALPRDDVAAGRTSRSSDRSSSSACRPGFRAWR